MKINNIFTKDFEGLVSKIGTHLLEQISKDYNLDFDELKSRYLEEGPTTSSNKRYKKPSGYTIFCGDIGIDTEIREELTKNNPGKKINGLVFKEKGRRWKALTKQEKEKWNTMAQTMSR